MSARPAVPPRGGPVRRLRLGALTALGAAAVVLGSGCGAFEGRVDLTSAPDPLQPLAGACFLVTRPFQVIPEPAPFEEGALMALAEGLVRGGYDVLGVGPEPPEDPDEVRERLADLNVRRPGTGAIHLTFVEAPSLVGFGTAYTRIHLTVYGPAGQVLLDEDMPIPERRSLVEAMVVPRLRPDIDGRRWGEVVWRARLATVFPKRP